MLNDVIFNGNTSAYEDWNIVLTDVEIGLPTPKTSFVDIKGSDGLLDLSRALTNDIKFGNRKIKLTFELLDLTEYQNLMKEICDYLHGKVVTLSFTNDDSFYYKGMATVNKWKCSKNKGSIVVDLDADPYKMETTETVITDTFASTNARMAQTKRVNLQNLRKSVCPQITVKGTVNLVYGENEIQLESGNYTLIDLVLREGDNIVTISGSGTITFKYHRGDI